MKRLKKWSFLCILGLVGCFFGIGAAYERIQKPGIEEGYGVIDEAGTGFEKTKPSTVYEKQPDNNPVMTAPVSDGDPANTIHNEEEGGSAEGSTEPSSSESSAEGSGDSTTDDAAQVPPPTYRDPSEVVYEQVDDNYFADAVFIGDSRTVGMKDYGGLEDISTFYASTGLTVYKIFTAPIVEVPDQKQKITIEEALTQKQFAKIYLMIGINEMGTGTVDSFLAKYQEVVTHLRELQPDAIIYLQGIMKVTTKRSDQGDYINNPGIDARNAGIAQMADNVSTYYLDVNTAICDTTGGLEPTYTFDGVHLKAQYIPLWKDYLKAHAAVLPY
jgi:lysophospholipase L1-like esterase